MGLQEITSCQLTGINSQMSMSAVKKCRTQADKNSLIFLALVLVHILFLSLHMRRTRETVITSDRTHSVLLLLFWQCEQFFFSFMSGYLSQWLRYVVEV